MRWMTKTTMGVLLAVLVAGSGQSAWAQVGLDSTLPESWAQEDPAARAYQNAREALSRRQFVEAAELFAAIRYEYRNSAYRADSYYWEAFSLYREGSRRNLESALELLDRQGEDHADARTRSDADALAVRIEAQLARRGDSNAAEAIVRRAGEAEQVCEGDAELRSAALSALMNLDSDQAIPILEEILRARDDDDECSAQLRRRAVFLVAQHVTPETVDILLDLAHRRPDPDQEVREQAVFWLHQVRGDEALDALQAILAESDDEAIQEKAIFAISQRRDERSAQILRSYAERDDVPVELRGHAIFWLGQNRNGGASYLIPFYEQLDNDELKEKAIFAIGQSRTEEAQQWLIARAADRDESIEVRKNALFWAGQTGAMAPAELTPFYESVNDSEMKEQVIFVASQMREPRAVDFLMDVALHEDDDELQKKAVFWLGQSKDPRVPEFLLELLRLGRRVR